MVDRILDKYGWSQNKVRSVYAKFKPIELEVAIFQLKRDSNLTGKVIHSIRRSFDPGAKKHFPSVADIAAASNNEVKEISRFGDDSIEMVSDALESMIEENL